MFELPAKWRTAAHAVNAKETSDFCRARGRYEVAAAFWSLHLGYYKSQVLGKRDPMDTAEDRAQYRDLFREYSAFAAEFPRLVATRNRILGAVAKLPAGIPVAQLRKAVSHSGKTKFGVMINQLVRGGWLVRSGDGEAARLTWGGALVDDMTFLKSEIGHPQGLFAVAAGGSAERKWWEFWKS